MAEWPPVGTIALTGGHSAIQVNQGSSTVLAQLTAASLVRATGATVNFSSNNNNLGGATDKLVFVAAPATAGSNGGILPYATVADGDFATYGANGVAAFTGYASSIAAAGPNDIVKLQ